MYKKIVFAVGIIALLVAPAFASNGVIVDLATGVGEVFGALFGVGQTRSAQQLTGAQIQQLREKAKEDMKKEARKIADAVEAKGYEKVSQSVLKLPATEGDWKIQFRIENNGKITAWSYTHKSNGWINFYLIDKDERIVMAIAQNAKLYITERAVEVYQDRNSDKSTKSEYVYDAAAPADAEKFDLFASVGFDVADNIKSKDGYLIVSKVKQGSIVSNRGMLEGTDLLQVDNMNTKQCTAEEIRSYIAKQAETNSTIAVYFMDENLQSKRVDVRLQ